MAERKNFKKPNRVEEKDEFDKNAYTVRADMEDNGSKILLLDKDLKANALEIVNMEKSKEDGGS